MNIIVRNEFRTEVLMSDEELEGYGVTYDDLDYKNAETRRVIRCIYDKICVTAGNTASFSGRILIEAVREKKDYIRICFTFLSAGEADPKSVKQLVKSSILPCCIDFYDFEALLRAVGIIKTADESELYEKGGVYRLVVYVPSEERFRLLHILGEFGEVRENSTVAEAQGREMYNCLISGNAVGYLRHLFLSA